MNDRFSVLVERLNAWPETYATIIIEQQLAHAINKKLHAVIAIRFNEMLEQSFFS
jgi:hypothetical protein